jgi:tetratricopeptide (TPR) repeat protein
MLHSRRALRAGLALLAAGALALAGCRTKSREVVINPGEVARLGEARELALRAQREQKAGHTDKAIDLYRQSLDQSRDLFFVWNNLGILLMEKQNYADAAEMFKSAADLAPTDPRPFFNIGLIYQRAVYDEQALEYFVKSLDRDPRYLPSLRGAIVSAKRLDITDEDALKRVRTALLLESDTKWRRIFETEALRIEGSISRASRGVAPIAPAPKTEHKPPETTPPEQPPAPGGG